MDHLANFTPLWEALGVKDGREYCRNRMRNANIRKQMRINEVEQRAARRAFIFRAAVVSPTWDEDDAARERRIDQLGHLALPYALAHMESRIQRAARVATGPDDPRFMTTSARATRRYERIRGVYERYERDERMGMLAIAGQLLDELEHDEDSPCDDEFEALEHLETYADIVRVQELEDVENGAEFDIASAGEMSDDGA